MIDDQDFFVETSDGLEQFVRHRGSEDPKGSVLIAHGMAEHSGRFVDVADQLAESGYQVYIPDHRGHGLTAARAKDPEYKTLGHFGDHNGWQKLIRDLRGVIACARADNPDLPLILLGHSMGSFLAQEVLYYQEPWVDALALSGTGISDPLIDVGIALAKMEQLIVGKRKPAPVLNFLGRRRFSRHIPGASKAHAWLSRDLSVGAAFMADSLCGFDLSSQAAIDLMVALKKLHKTKNLEKIRKNMPVYIFGGTEDALSWDGEASRWLATKYQMLGIKPVRLKIYEGARHECLHEINKEEVIRNLIAWCDFVVDRWTK